MVEDTTCFEPHLRLSLGLLFQAPEEGLGNEKGKSLRKHMQDEKIGGQEELNKR